MREGFFPDGNIQPHIHVHKGGVTFKSPRGHHKDLADNGRAMENNANAVVADLLEDGFPRATQLLGWIRTHIYGYYGIQEPAGLKNVTACRCLPGVEPARCSLLTK